MQSAEILFAGLAEGDTRTLRCLEMYRATFVRTYEEAKQALQDSLFRVVVIDLNFDGGRVFDLLQHIRSLARFDGVPVICVQLAEFTAAFSAALERVVRTLGGRAFVDLRGEGDILEQAVQRVCQMVAVELGGPPGTRV
jgi:hypothetical protein